MAAFKSGFLALVFYASTLFAASASDFNAPWRNKQKAIIIDAYEKNPINWTELVKNKQIRAFIGKASDGMPSPYACPGNATEKKICKKSFQNYWMKQQLYHTRKALAKALGLKWGAYHLGRPGNPIDQANHFIEFTQPQADELIALDIEHDDHKKWISFKDAEIFAKHIYTRIGRYPVLYTNHDTAKRIAARKDEFPILSRLPLWYARYKSDIRGIFPMGNWEKYNMWQFSARPNCGKRRCLYRVKGTQSDIDVNVSPLSISEFEKAWPFNGLVPKRKPESKVKPEVKPKPELKPALPVLLVKKDAPQIQVVKTTPLIPVPTPRNSIPELHGNEEARFQLASIEKDELIIPTPLQRGGEVEVASVVKAATGISTTDFEPEEAHVELISHHVEDFTMQLQFLSGAL